MALGEPALFRYEIERGVSHLLVIAIVMTPAPATSTTGAAVI